MSGPDEREQIDQTLLCRAIADARREGYNVVGLSGGEPLMYRPLIEVLAAARRLGMLTTVTSNGMLLTKKNLARLAGVTSLLAISLDGTPASHNRMRNSDRAFDVMAGNLEHVRDSGVPFGFIFTLTQYNVHELDWVADFAVKQGARLLQIHPLEEVGRATQTLRGSEPDERELSFGVAEALRIQKSVGQQLTVQLDVASRAGLRAGPGRVYAAEVNEETSEPLAELVAPLVIEPDGEVVPLQYGFPRAYAVGNLHERRLSELVPGWRRDRLASYLSLCMRTHGELAADSNAGLFNWYGAIASRATTPA